MDWQILTFNLTSNSRCLKSTCDFNMLFLTHYSPHIYSLLSLLYYLHVCHCQHCASALVLSVSVTSPVLLCMCLSVSLHLINYFVKLLLIYIGRPCITSLAPCGILSSFFSVSSLYILVVVDDDDE